MPHRAPHHDGTDPTPEQLHAHILRLEGALAIARHNLHQARALIITADDTLRRATPLRPLWNSDPNGTT